MFFLIAVIFIIQIVLLSASVFWLLSLDVKILMLSDALESYNSWFASRAGSIEGIFSDIKLLIERFQNKLRKKKKRFIIGQIINIIEWILILLIKNKNKKFLLGYKIAKTLSEELSLFKNMV